MSTGALGNLPAELTSFVGRRDELFRAKNLLSSTRLLTLTGMGGIGKSRFGRQLASEVRRIFPDGAWLVELADLQQDTLLVQTVGRALGIRDESSDPLTHLIAHLREKRLLLVLDNCEHLADPCARLVATLLKAASGIRIVATSRHVLGVGGETVLPIASLAHVADGGSPSEAVELFEERGSAADPDFRITEHNRDAVAEICERLGGLPLALELAAARVRTLSPAEILDRLASADVLSSDEPTRPARHRTVRSAIEWSLRLCTAPQRRVWEQLSVFSGGFTVKAAEAVCVETECSTAAALMGLVDKSIISRVRGKREEHARYHMLEPVREFAAEMLAASPREGETRRRHRDHFFELAARSRTEYCSERDVEWFAEMREEQANIRAALEFGLSNPDELETCLQMATSLRGFWQQCGAILEGYRWLTAGLRNHPAHDRTRASALISAAVLGFLLNEDAHDLLREHVEICRAQGYDEFEASALFARSLAAFAEGDTEKAYARAEDAVRSGMKNGERGLVAESMALAALYSFVIEREDSEPIAERFLQYTCEHGTHLLKAIALWPVGINRWRDSDISGATATLRESIRLYTLFEQPGMIAVCVEGLAWCSAEDEPARAATLLGAAKSIWNYSQMRMPETAVQRMSRNVESRLRQELGDESFDQVFAEGKTLHFDQSVALALGSEPGTSSRRRLNSDDAGLTRREREIAALVSEGLTNKEIATKLVISPRTVDAHVEHILAKLGFRSRAQVARWFSGDRGDRQHGRPDDQEQRAR